MGTVGEYSYLITGGAMDLPWGAAWKPPADRGADGTGTSTRNGGTGTGDGGTEAYVMASRFELTSGWRSPAFLAQAVRAWRQARRSPGVLGVTLRAQPLRLSYWTLSAWTGK